jgi:hypothetical protein
MNKKVHSTYEAWQSAVRQHQEQVRNAHGRGLSPIQNREMTEKALFAVDAAFARYKKAQAEPEHRNGGDLLEAALRALTLPLPEGPVH